MKEAYAKFANASSKLILRLMKALAYGMKMKVFAIKVNVAPKATYSKSI